MPGLSRDICVSWAESTFAEAKIPAPARSFCKNPRLLLMFFSFEYRMSEFPKWIGYDDSEFRRTYTDAASSKESDDSLGHFLATERSGSRMQASDFRGSFQR